MGFIYERKDSAYLWLSFVDADGNRRLESSKTTDRARAENLLSSIEKEVARERELRPKEAEHTVTSYSKMWLEERRRRGIGTVKEDENRLRHALPRLGKLRLSEVKPRHLRDLVRELETAGELAPRTIIHVYSVLRVMFGDAVTEELIPATPCVLKQRRGELPKKVDADPTWRPNAVFTADEVEQILSDQRIPEWRRVLYGLLFLGCCRINEATPRRWRDLQPGQPLDQLRISSSYSLKRRSVKSVKTEWPREMPVHPTLAKMLARWRLSGWQAMHGRSPKEDDLIVPGEGGGILNSNWTLKRFHQDLELLGLRARRQHDARRTFISIARGNGARKDILRWATHGPEGDVVDLYTSPPWNSLCEQVLTLNISLREGKLIRLPVAARGGATAVLRPLEVPEMTQQKVGRGGTRNLPSTSVDSEAGAQTGAFLEGAVARDQLGSSEQISERSNVTAEDAASWGVDAEIGCGR